MPPASASCPSAAQSDDHPILSHDEVARRMLLLNALHAALDSFGIRCVLARNHRLVLRYNEAPVSPSGLTDPRLHIFFPCGTRTAVTDGAVYRLDTGETAPAGDPAAATRLLTRTLPAAASA